MNKLGIRFQQLEAQAEDLLASKKTVQGALMGPRVTIDGNDLTEWKVKVKSLLINACGPDSEHYKAFDKAEYLPGMPTNLDRLMAFRAVFNAAKDDYDGGYLTSVRSLVQSELFDSELEQAAELLDKGYHVAAAVIAGVVLETGLREVCDRNQIPHAPLDRMNAELTKIGVFSKLVQKQITALADIRNSAAHGRPENFSTRDVEQMIKGVGEILGRYLV